MEYLQIICIVILAVISFSPLLELFEKIKLPTNKFLRYFIILLLCVLLLSWIIGFVISNGNIVNGFPDSISEITSFIPQHHVESATELDLINESSDSQKESSVSSTSLPTLTPLPIPTNSPVDTAPSHSSSTSLSQTIDSTQFIAYASSTYQLKNNTGDYSVDANMVVDGNLNTAWNEGASGTGIGEWITLQPSDGIQRTYTGFMIANGFQYHSYHKGDRWIKNNRVSSLAVYADKHYIGTFDILDLYDGYQTVAFPEPVYCLSLKFEIKGVVNGVEFSDTCISELRPY